MRVKSNRVAKPHYGAPPRRGVRPASEPTRVVGEGITAVSGSVYSKGKKDCPAPTATTMACTCWCEARFVSVPREMLFAGQTLSCGKDACHAP